MKTNGRIQKKMEAYSFVLKCLGILNEEEWKKIRNPKCNKN